jgi:hypothetical protein
MRKIFNLTISGAAAALLALCACAPASRASIIVDNTADASGGHTAGTQQIIQDFTPTINGKINLVTLNLYSTVGGSLNVYLYSGQATSTSDGTLVGQLGTLTLGTGGNQSLSLSGGSLTGFNLTSGTVYGIEFSINTSIGWQYTSSATTATGSNGSFDGHAWGDGGSGGVTWTQGAAYGIMAVDVVPEVPTTGLVMGFGVLAIAAGHVLRRKLNAVSAAKN